MRILKINLLLFTFLLSSFLMMGQSTGDVVVLLQGKVLDKSGNPVKVKLTFSGDDGKKITTTSNSTDGFYQQVLKPGVKYSVQFKDYLAVGNSTVEVPSVTKYTEMSSSFTIQRIEPGLELLTFAAFDPQDSVLTDNYVENFAFIEEFLRTNINASLIITVSMNDSYFKKKRVRVKYKDKRGRKRSKRVTLKPMDQLKPVLAARLAAVQDYVATLKIRHKKVSFKTDETMGPKPPKKKKKKRRKKKKKKKKEEPAPPPPPRVHTIKIEVGKIIKM